ncbi:MAG: TlpA family protein disulfide reductase [Candidatus Omnitrophica bacterium]|nr:TlpA family protein disulfide reductase [Candidatus Omnitrophota bacterium]
MKTPLRILMLIFLLTTAVKIPQAMGQFFFFRHPLIGKEAPDFTLDTLKNTNVNFTAYRQDQPAILFFWATWCAHCRTQIKVLSEEIPALNQEGIKVALIDLQENPRLIKRYLNSNKLNVDIFMDSDAYVAQEYGVQGVPTFVFVDKSGLVKAVEHYMSDDYKDLIL